MDDDATRLRRLLPHASVATIVAAVACLGLFTGSASAVCWSSRLVIAPKSHASSLSSLVATANGRSVGILTKDVGRDPSVPAGSFSTRDLYQASAYRFRARSLDIVERSRLAAPNVYNGQGQAVDDASGDIVTVWNSRTGWLWSRLRAGSSAWSPARAVPTFAGERSADWKLVARPDGSVMLIWETLSEDSGWWWLRASSLAPGATRWGGPTPVSKIPNGGPSNDPLFVEQLPSGGLRVVWGHADLRRWVQLPAGSVPAWRDESSQLEAAHGLRLTAGADGTLVAIWDRSRVDGSADGARRPRASVYVAVRHAGEPAFSKPQQLTPNAPGIAGAASVTIGVNGAATLFASTSATPAQVVVDSARHTMTAGAAEWTRSAAKVKLGTRTYRLLPGSTTFTPIAHGLQSEPFAFVPLTDGTTLAFISVGYGLSARLEAARGIPGSARWASATPLGTPGVASDSLVAIPTPDGGALIAWSRETPNPNPRVYTWQTSVLAGRFTQAGPCRSWGLARRH
ncbi:MAG TPA: hypothetical protein VGO31_10075 [Microbacteriaceae bacterium]|nr:hypothetical protein [Microbacteriaceae bacterium]